MRQCRLVVVMFICSEACSYIMYGEEVYIVGDMKPSAVFVYDDLMASHVLRPDHPLKAIRLRYTYDLLNSYHAFDNKSYSELVKPRSSSYQEICTVHESEYVDAVISFGKGETVIDPARFNFSRTGDNPFYRGMYEAASLSTGASLVAAEMVATGNVHGAFNISGGLHHAAVRHASGFCVFNDPAIAIRYLANLGMKIAYIDIDAHHGDGVQDVFYDTDQVLTISIHESGKYLFPGTGSTEELGVGRGKGYSVNLPLYPYTGDDLYMRIFRETVPQLIAAFNPDILVTQLGIDTYFNDPLTHIMLSSNGFTQAVQEFARMGLPWLALGGGGYDIGAVARCWAIAYGVMINEDWPDLMSTDSVANLGYENLNDTAVPEVPEYALAEATKFAENSLWQVKKTIFPIHRIS